MRDVLIRQAWVRCRAGLDTVSARAFLTVQLQVSAEAWTAKQLLPTGDVIALNPTSSGRYRCARTYSG